jgi:hypothetical protein
MTEWGPRPHEQTGITRCHALSCYREVRMDGSSRGVAGPAARGRRPPRQLSGGV